MDNLVSNAIKFTDEGGTVTLRARADEETVTLEVEDEGVGIDEDFLPDLFEAFARGPGQTQDGSGLGLAITHRLTDVMGGTIDVESEKGVGTRFTVRLPRYDEE
jgi:signal transduction histidine kinase